MGETRATKLSLLRGLLYAPSAICSARSGPQACRSTDTEMKFGAGDGRACRWPCTTVSDPAVWASAGSWIRNSIPAPVCSR